MFGKRREIKRAWRVLATSAMGASSGVASLAFNCPVAFVDPLIKEFGWRRAHVSASLGILTVAMFLVDAARAMPNAASPANAADFVNIYRDLVETDTTHNTGACTAASNKMLTRMKAAGFPANDLHAYATADHPKEGGLVAILRSPNSGKSKGSSGAILLIAHIDVVDVARADWLRAPFALIEDGGYFHGRGVSDNKAMAAALVDMLIRFHREGYRPARDIKIALTCGEETASAFNGAEYLATQRRDLIAADLALVPSGGATLDAQGRPVSLTIQTGEKVQQNFRIEAKGTASHASRPTPDNAIYRLADALARISRYRFPVELNAATRLYFERTAATVDPATANAIRGLLENPADKQAEMIVSANPAWNGMLRNTCVATLLDAGQTANTVPARAGANLNCRLLPAHDVAEIQDVLMKLIADPEIALMPVLPIGSASVSPPITSQVLEPITKLAKEIWPGVAIVPMMLTGATDARHLNAVGIPAYGLTAVFNDPDGNGVHAANERVRVKSVMDGREFVYRLVKVYADQATR